MNRQTVGPRSGFFLRFHLSGMMFHVPQFVDVEDRIAGPLTVKQLLWMIGMAAAILVARLLTGGGAWMYVLSVPIVAVFALFAFYKPNGRPLISFVINGIFYLSRPKVMVWRRPHIGAVYPSVHRKAGEEVRPAPDRHELSAEKIREVSAMLDKR